MLCCNDIQNLDTHLIGHWKQHKKTYGFSPESVPLLIDAVALCMCFVFVRLSC